MRTIILFSVLLLSASTSAAIAAAPSPAPFDPAQIDQTLSAAHAAAGGARLDAFASMTQSGTFTQNGGPASRFDAFTNLANGYSKTRVVIGPATILQGFDGAQWTQSNGVLSVVSLSSFVADANTQAYLSSNAFFRTDQRSTVTGGFRSDVDGRPTDVLHVEPAGGSPADLYFDSATHQLVKIVAQTAQGPDSTTFSNFQTVQGVPVAMRSVDVNSSATTTITEITSTVFSATADPLALARPPYVSQGRLAAPVTIPFVSDAIGTLGHIVVPLSLDDKPASFIFDSGASNFLLPGAAQRLGLHPSGGVATGGVGTKQQMTAFANIETVNFGGARLANQNFIVTPLSYPLMHPRKNVAPEGLIGFEYLANFRVTVRYAERRMILAPFDSPSPADGVTLPLKSDGNHAYVLATIDGVSGYFLLDTGNAGGIVLNAPFVQENHLFPNGGLTYATPGGVGGGYTVTVAAAKSVAFAGRQFTGVPVGLPHVNAGFFATRGIAGNLGSAFLQRFTVIFDYKAQTVTFIPNRNAAMPFRSDRIGLSLNQSAADAFEVIQTVPGSPAATAGIAIGDRIVAFAGKRVASGFGLGDFIAYSTGRRPFRVTFVRGSVSHTVLLSPRALLPPPQ